MTEKRRQRRTKADIERSIRQAGHELVNEKGFGSVLLTDITKRADIEPVVFYNRYANLEAFFTELIGQYDYWLQDSIKNEAAAQPSAKNCDHILNGLFSALCNDKTMLEILRWEVCTDNELSERTAMLREMQNMQLIKKYKKLFRDSGNPIDISAFAALMIGGIYYLMLHKDRSTFCGLDLNDPAARDTLRRTISQLTALVFS